MKKKSTTRKNERTGWRRLPARLLRYRTSDEQVPGTSRTEVTRNCGAFDESDRDELAAPGSPAGLAPASELELFCNVPFTSTFLPTSVEKLEALPVKRYVVPLDIELLAPAGLGVVEPAVPVAVDDDPLDVVASVRM